VLATVRNATGETETIRAAYLAGCDGAHSRVRNELGLDFDGHPYDDDDHIAAVGDTTIANYLEALFESPGGGARLLTAPPPDQRICCLAAFSTTNHRRDLAEGPQRELSD